MKPQRKCIGCNVSEDKDKFLRIVLSNSCPVVDKKKVLPGRGCYVHDNENCIQNALKRNAIQRALKSDISKEALGRCFNDR